MRAYWVSSNPHALRLVEELLRNARIDRVDRAPRNQLAATGSEGVPAVDGQLRAEDEDGEEGGEDDDDDEDDDEDGDEAEEEVQGQAPPPAAEQRAVYLHGPGRIATVFQDA